MSSDKRSVSTDALATLGTIIEDGGRDAIHLAVEPVVAGEPLAPGEDIGIENGIAYGKSDHIKKVGIVDPFLKDRVEKGQKFWLIVYPRQITSLRHVWEHPDFPQAHHTEIALQVASKLNGDRDWVERFAADLDMTYNALMKAAVRWITTGDYHYDNTESYKNHYDKFPEFWERYEKITGEQVSDKSSFFTCSC